MPPISMVFKLNQKFAVAGRPGQHSGRVRYPEGYASGAFHTLFNHACQKNIRKSFLFPSFMSSVLNLW